MDYYTQCLDMYLKGFITEADCTLRILDHFGENPGSYRAAEAQVAKENLEQEEASLGLDREWLNINF